MEKHQIICDFIRSLYPKESPIPLHAPRFIGNEKKYLADCIDSTFVSYIGKYVDLFEDKIKEFTGAKYAAAMVNGTTAIQIGLIVSGVKTGDLVITQPLTFAATCNAIVHAGAMPVFVDVEKDNLGMSPEKLEELIENECRLKDDGFLYHKESGKKISACVPVHIFGIPNKIDKIVNICKKYNLNVIEDAAESLGSYFLEKHTGTFGKIGILSFNGNKIITTGGGGMIITEHENLALKAKHISTTAKKPHPYEYFHDEIGYNYRMPNVNAAIGVAQMENLKLFLENKRNLSKEYIKFFGDNDIKFIQEPVQTKSNYWLNTILLNDRAERNEFLEYSNSKGIMTRPAWVLMNKLPMFENCYSGDLSTAEFLESRLVNLPSSVRI